jgi:hypothetical protein
MINVIFNKFPDFLFIKLDGLDAAITGHCLSGGDQVLVYSLGSILQILVDRDGMDFDEALEFYYFNIEPLGMMKRGPYFFDDISDDSE